MRHHPRIPSLTMGEVADGGCRASQPPRSRCHVRYEGEELVVLHQAGLAPPNSACQPAAVNFRPLTSCAPRPGRSAGTARSDAPIDHAPLVLRVQLGAPSPDPFGGRLGHQLADLSGGVQCTRLATRWIVAQPHSSFSGAGGFQKVITDWILPPVYMGAQVDLIHRVELDLDADAREIGLDLLRQDLVATPAMRRCRRIARTRSRPGSRPAPAAPSTWRDPPGSRSPWSAPRSSRDADRQEVDRPRRRCRR